MLRAVGYLIPFITLPFFVRLIPAVDYGRLGVMLTACGILSAVCEGGANIGGAKRLTLAQTERERRAVSHSIYGHKLLLLTGSLAAGLIYSYMLAGTVADLTLFTVCFLFIVVPDALTPTWVFYSTGAVDELSSRLFLSRVISLAPGMLLVWLIPNSLTGAVATGIPFVIFAFIARRRANTLLANALTTDVGPIKAQGNARTLLHLGSLAALTFPALVMQSQAWSGHRQLGMVYLSISIWVALRQLCIIPNQAAFHIAVKRSIDPIALQHRLRRAIVLGAGLAVAGAAFVFIAGRPLLRLAFGSEYAHLDTVLVPLFCSVALFIAGHGIAMNRLAANGRYWAFLLSYLSSISTFLLAFIVLVHVGDNARLIWSVIGADLALLVAACAFDLGGRRKLPSIA